MPSLVERCKNLWTNISQSSVQIPSRVVIPYDHVDDGESLKEAFRPEEHYFQVRINEMYLTYKREWFSKYAPMVFVVSEFIYDKKMEAVPFIVGPTMMEKFGQKIPEGMLFSDTRVAGLHPYRGDRLILSVVLCRVQRTNYAQKFLQLIENAAKALNSSQILDVYMKISHVVLDGIESLFGLGDIDPLIGFRKEFDPEAGEIVKPSYFALINLPETELEANELWVRKRQLVYGKSLSEAKPFRGADYVLYSISQTTERNDEETLPFYPTWERIKEIATDSSREDIWDAVKSNITGLWKAILLSPDLTAKHAEKLFEQYCEDVKILHERAIRLTNMGTGEEDIVLEWDASSTKVRSIIEQ